MNKEQLLASGKISKTIIQLSIPLIISQVVNVLYNIVDRIYIGNIPGNGKEALAGLGVTFPILMVLAAFATLFGTGGAPLASIKLGENKKTQGSIIMTNSFISLVFIGIILNIIIVIFTEEILYLFGAKTEIINYSIDYLKIYSFGTVAVMLTLGLNSYITAQGFSRNAMTSVIIGAVMNIILDPVFIYLFKLGISGAALATIISQYASATYTVLFLLSKKSILKLSLTNLKLDFKVVISIMALGISPFIMNATESLVQISFNQQIKNYAVDNYVTYINLLTVLLSVMQIVMMPMMGISQGAAPLISYNYGAGNIPRVRETFRLLLKFSLGYSLLFYTLIFIMPGTFTRIFNNDPELLSISPNIFRIFFCGISIMGIQFACQNTFIALRQPLISLPLALLRKVILLIPLIFIMPLFFGISGVFYAEAIGDIIAVSVTAIVFKIKFKKILAKKAKG